MIGMVEPPESSKERCAGPDHAFEGAATTDAVFVIIVVECHSVLPPVKSSVGRSHLDEVAFPLTPHLDERVRRRSVIVLAAWCGTARRTYRGPRTRRQRRPSMRPRLRSSDKCCIR